VTLVVRIKLFVTSLVLISGIKPALVETPVSVAPRTKERPKGVTALGKMTSLGLF
jgi:hypothetical protein